MNHGLGESDLCVYTAEFERVLRRRGLMKERSVNGSAGRAFVDVGSWYRLAECRLSLRESA